MSRSATARPKPPRVPFDGAQLLRRDFPLLARKPEGELVYLDSAATAQKPQAVLDAMQDFYTRTNANVHRGAYRLSNEATEAYEGARAAIARHLGAPGPEQIVFTRGTTEAINLVAHGWARRFLGPTDEILLTPLEHHSNIVPWHMTTRVTGAKIRWAPLTQDGRIDLQAFRQSLTRRTRLVCVTHVSNVLGTVNPIADLATWAHDAGAVLLVDGAQGVPHRPVNVRELNCDFYAFSGHKVGGPTGIGILYGKSKLLESMEPFQGGGDMIKEVTREGATWNDVPWKFEAGTMPMAEVVGLRAALEYLERLSLKAVEDHDRALVTYAMDRLEKIPGLTLYGPRDPAVHAAAVSFNMEGIHPHDLATVLDSTVGVAIRAGHHCAQPLMETLGVAGTARASFFVYNTPADVDRLVEGLGEARKVFNG